MRRLTITPAACAETLSVLVSLAWADGQLDDRERAGVRGAAEVLNLTKEHRAQIDAMLAKPPAIENARLGGLSRRDRDFVYVAAAWMCEVDDDVGEKEEAMLDRLAVLCGIEGVRKAQLEGVARNLVPAPGGGRKWADEVMSLFKAIPPHLEPEGPQGEEIEVAFE
jgi:uncharacterized membrane protein YebE (DUF533 family)